MWIRAVGWGLRPSFSLWSWRLSEVYGSVLGVARIFTGCIRRFCEDCNIVSLRGEIEPSTGEGEEVCSMAVESFEGCSGEVLQRRYRDSSANLANLVEAAPSSFMESITDLGP